MVVAETQDWQDGTRSFRHPRKARHAGPLTPALSPKPFAAAPLKMVHSAREQFGGEGEKGGEA